MFNKKVKCITVMFLSTCMVLASGCSNNTASVEPDSTATTASVISKVESQLYRSTDTSSNLDKNSTILYYKNEDGLIVPIMRKLDKTLDVQDVVNLLISTDEISADLTKMNLSALIPKDTTVVVTLDDKVANVNFKNLKNKNAKDEASMVAGVVNTLLSLPTVDSVRITLNGKAAEQMAYGTNISKHITQLDYNVETISRSVNVNTAKKIKLYYLSPEGYLIVPTIRYIETKVTAENLVNELLKGPDDAQNLLTGIPEGTKLNSSKISADGIVTLDFSSEFNDIKEYTELNTTILKTIILTCEQLKEVQGVEITVDGEALEMDTTTLSSPVYANEY